MKFVTPEVEFDNVESIDFISYSTDRIVNTGYTDPDGALWTPRY